MRLGRIISKIRINKNIPIKYLTNQCMSISTYEYFIEGKINISADKLLILINRLNLDWKDFEYIYHKYNNPSLTLSRRIKIAILNKNIQVLRKIKDEITSNHFIKFDINNIYNRYFHLYCLLNIYIEVLTNKKIQYKYKYPIKEYLLKRYSWTYYELSLFDSIYFIFNLKTVNIFTKRVVKDFIKYKNLIHNEDGEVRFLINVINLYIKHKKLIKVPKLITLLKNSQIPDNMTLEKLILKYFIGLYHLLINKKSGIYLIKESLKYLKFTNPHTYYPAIKRNYHHILRIYRIKDKLKNI